MQWTVTLGHEGSDHDDDSKIIIIIIIIISSPCVKQIIHYDIRRMGEWMYRSAYS
jgi:hypothetical protein